MPNQSVVKRSDEAIMWSDTGPRYWSTPLQARWWAETLGQTIKALGTLPPPVVEDAIKERFETVTSLLHILLWDATAIVRDWEDE